MNGECTVQLGRRGLFPIKGSNGSAGYDLYSANSCIVPSFGRLVVDTDLKICLPKGTYGRIAPRSGLAIKHFLDIGGGVIDSDFRGILKVVIFNFSEEDYTIMRGDRIAQLIITPIWEGELVKGIVDDVTNRGENGFGSTGR